MNASLSALRQFTQRLQPRERLALGLALLVLGAYLLWAVALAPALRTLRSVPDQPAQADLQLAEVRALAQQARGLLERQRAQPLPRADSLQALETATRQTLGNTARIEPVGERVTVTLTAAPPEAVAQWLAQARLNARLLPVESRLQRSGDAAAPRWSGTVVLGGAALASTP